MVFSGIVQTVANFLGRGTKAASAEDNGEGREVAEGDAEQPVKGQGRKRTSATALPASKTLRRESDKEIEDDEEDGITAGPSTAKRNCRTASSPSFDDNAFFEHLQDELSAFATGFAENFVESVSYSVREFYSERKEQAEEKKDLKELVCSGNLKLLSEQRKLDEARGECSKMVDAINLADGVLQGNILHAKEALSVTRKVVEDYYAKQGEEADIVSTSPAVAVQTKSTSSAETKRLSVSGSAPNLAITIRLEDHTSSAANGRAPKDSSQPHIPPSQQNPSSSSTCTAAQRNTQAPPMMSCCRWHLTYAQTLSCLSCQVKVANAIAARNTALIQAASQHCTSSNNGNGIPCKCAKCRFSEFYKASDLSDLESESKTVSLQQAIDAARPFVCPRKANAPSTAAVEGKVNQTAPANATPRDPQRLSPLADLLAGKSTPDPGTATNESGKEKETPQPSTSTAAAAKNGPATSASNPDSNGDKDRQPTKKIKISQLNSIIDKFLGGDEDTPMKISQEVIDKTSPLSFDTMTGFDAEIKLLRENVLFPLANKGMKETGFEPAKGIIFGGPSDTGKLLIAKALTAELSRMTDKEYTLMQRLRCDAFNKYTGQAEIYLKKLLLEVFSKKYVVLFLYEIDTLFQMWPSHSLTKETTTQLIEAFDKIERGEIIIIGATEKISKIPATLSRTGRFEKTITFESPNEKRRRAVIEEFCAGWKNKPSDEEMNEILKKTAGFSSEDLEQMCKESYALAMKRIYAANAKESPEKPNYTISDKDLESFEVKLEDWSSALGTLKAEKTKKANTKPNSCFFDEESPAIVPESIDEDLSFASVGGLDEQIENLKENIVFPMLNKAALMEWGMQPIKGMIFHGPPGTGKSLLAKTLATELSRLGGQPFSFFYRKGTDTFNKYVGETETRLRAVFAEAEAKKPSIIFFDEIDGLCGRRSEDSAASKFYNGVVTTMLGNLDGIKRGEVFVIAATNRLDTLDPALTRPGRFDKTIAFFPPREPGRKSILKIHSSQWKRGNTDEFLEVISKLTEGYTGADLEQLCRQTFFCALRRHFPCKTAGKLEVVRFADLDILMEDWYTALTTVKGSNSNVFGSSLLSGRSLPPAVTKLISGICKEILDSIQPLLKVQTHTPGNEKGGGLKSFLIWDSGKHQDQIIENFIVPNLISSNSMTDVIAYSLQDQHFAKGKESLKPFISGLISSPKAVILYIPQLDKLEAKLAAAGCGRLFMEQMDLLRGENVLVLASASCPVSEVSDGLRLIFKGINRSYEIGKLNNAECREFFAFIFKDKFPHLLDRAEKVATGGSLYDILGLKDELNNALVNGSSDEKELTKVLEDIINLYEKNKFDDGGKSRNNMYT